MNFSKLQLFLKVPYHRAVLGLWPPLVIYEKELLLWSCSIFLFLFCELWLRFIRLSWVTHLLYRWQHDIHLTYIAIITRIIAEGKKALFRSQISKLDVLLCIIFTVVEKDKLVLFVVHGSEFADAVAWISFGVGAIWPLKSNDVIRLLALQHFLGVQDLELLVVVLFQVKGVTWCYFENRNVSNDGEMQFANFWWNWLENDGLQKDLGADVDLTLWLIVKRNVKLVS